MTMATAPIPSVQKRVTPEELLLMPDEGVNYELVDGQLVERHMGLESSRIALEIARLLGNFLAAAKVGRLYGADASYQCFPDAADKVRKPDVSFIRAERMPAEPLGHCRIAPDLAVEVVSPNDLAYEIDAKVDDYLRAGVRLVWVVSPRNRTVLVYRATGSPKGLLAGLTEHDAIEGEDVLPGFTCPVGEFFRRA